YGHVPIVAAFMAHSITDGFILELIIDLLNGQSVQFATEQNGLSGLFSINFSQNSRFRKIRMNISYSEFLRFLYNNVGRSRLLSRYIRMLVQIMANGFDIHKSVFGFSGVK